MDPISMIFVFLFVFLPVILGSVVYFPARLEWNDTFKRAALIAKANLGSNKSQAVLAEEKMALNPYIGDPDDKVAMAVWESQFTGKELMLVTKDAHTIVKSWNALEQTPYDEFPVERWYWECACGESESRKVKEASKAAAKRHLALYKGRNKDDIREIGWLK